MGGECCVCSMCALVIGFILDILDRSLLLTQAVMFLKFSTRSMFYSSLTLLILLQTFCTLKEKLTLAICFFFLHLSKTYLSVFEGKGKWKGTFEHMYNVNDSTWPFNFSYPDLFFPKAAPTIGD